MPPLVANLIDRMLARSPEDRPDSAQEVLDLLSGAAVPSSAAELPWLGGTEEVQRACAAATRGEAVTVHGTPGAGRTRALGEIAARLRAEGRTVAWLQAGERPYTSLAAALGVSPGPTLAARIDAPDRPILIADDPTAIDPWSASLLEGQPRCVRVVAEPDATLALHRLPAAALTPLFYGPRPIAERAAFLMYERTCGLPSRLAVEVGYWIVEGVARRCGGLRRGHRDERARRAVPFRVGWGGSG